MHILSNTPVSIFRSKNPLKLSLEAMIGERGVILDAKGKKEPSFKLGVGGATNNQVEALNLYQWIKIIDSR